MTRLENGGKQVHLVTPELTYMVRQVQTVVGAPACVPFDPSGKPYNVLDWPGVRMMCIASFDIKRRTLVCTH